MSQCIQLEFEMGSKEHAQLDAMQAQINGMSASMDKVRRKLFAELSEVKKTLGSLEQENEQLRAILKELRDQKTEWQYCQEGYLFRAVG